MSKLKNCAECGGRPIIKESGYIYIYCGNCDCLVDIPHTNLQAAYWYWDMVQTQKEKRET